MIAHLAQQVRDARRRIAMAIGRGVLAAINDATQAQEVQIELLDGEVANEIERFQEYGFTSAPYAGAEAVMVGVGGLRSHGIVIAVEDRRYRMTGLKTGEVALYDDLGQQVYLTRTGILIASAQKITLQSGTEVDVNAPKAVVIANEVDLISSNVQLGAAGGKKVALDGDPVVGGKVVASSMKVTAA